MLTSMRKTSSSLFVKLLFVLLIASFAIWGIGDVLRPSAGGGPIEVGDKQIGLATIDREFRGILDQQSRAVGFRFTPAMGLQFGMLDRAISNVVTRALYDNLATDLGIRIDDESVRDFIRDRLGFRTDDGRFDRAAFEQELRNRQVTEDAFVEELRADIARDDLVRTVGAGIRLPNALAAALHAYREETRVADYFKIAAEDMPAPAAPAEDVLTAYYEANGELYMAPEFRSGDVVVLDPAEIAAGIAVDDEQLNEEFLYQRDSLYVPERRTVEQMILADAAQAEAAAAALGEGRDFASVASEVAGQDAAALAMGAFSSDEWFVAEAKDALFDGDVGAVSAPVETPLGWRIYRVTAIEPGREAELDDVRDTLIDEIRTRIARDEIFDLAGRVQDEMAGGASLAEAARTLEIAVQPVGPISADGQDPEGLDTVIPGGDPVVAALFEQAPDADPDQRDLPGGGVFFVAVTVVTEPAVRPLAEVRDTVLADWTADQQMEAARALAQTAKDALAAGTGFGAVADAHSLLPLVATGIRRDGSENAGLPSGLAATLFEAAVGAADSEEAPAERAVYVAQLKEIVPAPEDAEALNTVRMQVSAQATSDLYTALGTELQGRYETAIQSDFIQQSFSQSYSQ
ncbi:MAG: SurA N-terminal domain-containing protein [Alphaproteobacteria bacterium]